MSNAEQNQPLFGETRTRVTPNHALFTPDAHVTQPLIGWQATEGVVLVSPAMGPAPAGPRFVQYLARLTKESVSLAPTEGVQRLVYVLSGKCELDGNALGVDDFAWFPPGDAHRITTASEAELLAFEKPYAPLAGVAVPKRVTGTLADAPAEPFMGDPDAMLSTLLPIEPGFDMAVNVFIYQSGAVLPLVETHVMEHGLYMKEGQGVYRLGENYYPVCEGDSIWMASYCPQWFVAMGKGPSAYIYYKDIHRDPLQP